MKNIFKVFILTALLVFSQSAFAFGENSPEIRANFKSKTPYSTSKLNWYLGIKVYDINLWTDAKKWSYNEKFALQIKYNINIKREKFTESSIKEIKRYYKIDDFEKTYTNKFNEIYPDVKKGDIITAIYNPKNGHTELFHNGKSKGKITDKGFSRVFLDIWLHENNYYQETSCELRQDCQ
jgi:hypothetical protein